MGGGSAAGGPQAAVTAWPEWSSAVCVTAGQQRPPAATRPLVRGRGRDGGAAAPGGRRELWIGDWCFIPAPQRQRLGSCLAPPLGSCLLRLGWSDPFRHLQSASVVGAQICSCRMLMNHHANATERRGHLGLKRRKSFERSAASYSPPAGGSTPDLNTRRCSRADFYQLSIRTERGVDPPSRIRHQKALAVSAEIDQCGKNDRAGERGAAPSCGQLHQACAPGFSPSLAGGELRNEEGALVREF